jgi:hypothetical protein
MVKIRKVKPGRLDDKGAASKKRDGSDSTKAPRDENRDRPPDAKAG